VVIGRRTRFAHVALTAAGVVLLAAAGGGVRAQNSVGAQPRQSFEVSLLTDPAPARSVLPAPEAPKAAAPQVQRRAAQPAQAQPEQPGTTSVTIQNGSSDTQTESGGSHISNNADVEANAGVSHAEPEPSG
jgi:hypothetical protein